MKTKLYSLLFIVCMTLSLSSCLNDDPVDDWSKVKPVIELPYAVNHGDTDFGTAGTEFVFKLMVNYTIADWRKQNDNIVVELGIDESLIGKNKLLPAYTYTLPASMTIAPQTQLTTTELKINSTGLEPGKYTLPVVIKNVPKGYIISGNFGHALFTITVQ